MSAGGFTSFVGVDWSGAKGRSQRGIAVARAEADGSVGVVEPRGRSWSREEVGSYLQSIPPGTLVGMDFAFSLPWPSEGPFPGEMTQPTSADVLWKEIDRLCREEPDFYSGPIYRPAGGHLAAYMFTKLTGAPRWSGASYDPTRLRETERCLRPPPNSAFKIVGAKTVGPGSFAGMRLLAQLRRAMGERLAVWPFVHADPARLTICEVYPTWFYHLAGSRRTDDPVKASAVAAHFGAVAAQGSLRNQDTCDATVAAAALRSMYNLEIYRNDLPEIAKREGWIFGVPLLTGASKPAA